MTPAQQKQIESARLRIRALAGMSRAAREKVLSKEPDDIPIAAIRAAEELEATSE